MGLTDFVKDVGKKIFGHEDEASEKVKDYIEAENRASRIWQSMFRMAWPP